MILDNMALLSEAQAITVTAPSTDVLDLMALGKTAYNDVQLLHKVGVREIPFLIQVVEKFLALTTLTISIQSDNDVAFGSPKELYSIAVPVAELLIGFKVPYDKLPIVRERYVRVLYTVGGAPATAGKITAGVVAKVDQSY